MCVHAKPLQSYLNLCHPMDWSRQAYLSMGFSRQEYWSRLPCPPPGDFPDPGREPTSYIQVDSLPLVSPGKPTVSPQLAYVKRLLVNIHQDSEPTTRYNPFSGIIYNTLNRHFNFTHICSHVGHSVYKGTP